MLVVQDNVVVELMRMQKKYIFNLHKIDALELDLCGMVATATATTTATVAIARCTLNSTE